jgi:choline dehydrogenase
VGIPHNPDFNGAAQEGAGYYQATIRKGRRASAATAYLKPAMRRPNLQVVTGTIAEKVVIEAGQATGLRIRRDGVTETVKCRREVLLAGGSVNSPQLLLLSGIGPASALRDLGIVPVRDLPGVGENLQDHYGAQITWKCNRPITMNDVMLSRGKQMMAGLRWLVRRDGPLSVPAGQAGLFARTQPNSATPDVQFLFQTFSGGYYEDGLFKFSGFANFICPVRPRSRGRLALASADPMVPPRLMPNYFSDEIDRRIAVAGLKLARRIAAAPPLADFITTEHLPGPGIRDDAEIEAYFRENGGCVSHQVGTCKMGSDSMAVVDDHLRVHGIAGLRVIDASIMPNLISGNTNAAAIMIGEKGADLVRRGA